MELSLFEKGTFNNYTFPTSKGNITIQQLCQLPLTSTSGRANLNDIAKALYKEQQEVSGSMSFVKAERTPKDEEVSLKLEIVKRVIEVREYESAQRSEAKANKERRDRIRGLIDKKKDEELAGKTIEELEKLL